MIPSVHISREAREIPGLALTFLAVRDRPDYQDAVARAAAEILATTAAQSLCGDVVHWRDIPYAQAYPDFYTMTGVRGSRYSTPFKQAFRFRAKPYRSVSPLIDACMTAEYGTGISFQAFKAPPDGRICVGRAAGTEDQCARPSQSELCLNGAGKLIHAPSLGLQPAFFLPAGHERAIVRMMRVPGLPAERMEQALDTFTAILAERRANWRIIEEWVG